VAGPRDTLRAACCRGSLASSRGRPWAPIRATIRRTSWRALAPPASPPHVAEKARGSALDGCTTWPTGYWMRQRARKKIEEVFGWLKTVAGLKKLKYRGAARVDWVITLACAAYNLVRLRRRLAD
jgi:hypothetical protein